MEGQSPYRVHRTVYARSQRICDCLCERELAEHGVSSDAAIAPPSRCSPRHRSTRTRPTCRCTAIRRTGTIHGYYDCYCYLPLYIFCGRHLLAARLRPASVDAAFGIVEEIARIAAYIREHWPDAIIVVRADSGFCRDDLMTWCEDNDVHFVLGCAKTGPLIGEIKTALAEAEAEHKATGHAARRFKSFDWTPRESWTRERRVVAKAEWTEGEANPRFIVTGGGLTRQRVARRGQGRSGGFRTVIVYRRLDRAVFLHGFAKSQRDNIDDDDLARLKKLAVVYLGASMKELERWCEEDELREVTCDDEEVS